MHIGFVSPEYVTQDIKGGGLATYVKKVGMQLAERGHSISVFYWSDRNGQWEDGLLKVYQVKRTRLPSRLRTIPYSGAGWFLIERLFTALRMKRRILGICQRNPIDVLHTSNFEAPAYLMRRNNMIPLVCRISSYRPLWFSTNRRSRDFTRYLGEWMELRQVLDADGVFAPSVFLARVFDQFVGIRPEVIRTPFESLPKSSWNSTFWKDNLQNRKYLLYFGNLNRTKGVDLVADISYHLLTSHPDLYLVFIGPNSHYKDNCSMVEHILESSSTCKDRILYSPPIDKGLLFPVISNALGVLMPSRADNYPNACLEAQSLGIPVIGSNNSSIEEMIIDGRTGFLIDNGDSDSLNTAIERLLLMTDTERQRMKRNIEDYVSERKKEDLIGHLEHYYQQVIYSFQIEARKM